MLTEEQKRYFEKLVLYCDRYASLIPVSFVLGGFALRSFPFSSSRENHSHSCFLRPFLKAIPAHPHFCILYARYGIDSQDLGGHLISVSPEVPP